MAIFPVNAGDALGAAVEMQLEVRKFYQERRVKSQQEIQIGVGMHTGPLIMGLPVTTTDGRHYNF